MLQSDEQTKEVYVRLVCMLRKNGRVQSYKLLLGGCQPLVANTPLGVLLPGLQGTKVSSWNLIIRQLPAVIHLQENGTVSGWYSMFLLPGPISFEHFVR